MEQKTQSVGVKWGLILGGILAAISILIYTIDIALFINTYFSFILMAIVITIGILTVNEYKVKNEGFGSFGDIFKQILIAFAIGIFISIIVKFIIFGLVDPEAAETLKELTIQKSIDMLDSFGLDISEDAIEEVENKILEKDLFSLSSSITNFVSLTFGNILFGLIIAAITKNEKPEFE